MNVDVCDVCVLEWLVELLEVEDVDVLLGVVEVLVDEDDGVGVGVGVGLVVGVGVGVGSSSFLELVEGCEELPPSALPAGKTTTFAVDPFGTVTTQKLEPPAPDAWLLLVTPPTPSTVGSIEQGSPLHPPPSHSILIPKSGGVLLKPLFCHAGFQAIFM